MKRLPIMSTTSNRSPGAESASILGHLLCTMLLCCCWPVHKCVTVLSCIDTLIVFTFAYKIFNTLYETIFEPHWLTVLSFAFFTFFFICQLLGTIFIILAHRRNIARYCYPRLVLLLGLVIVSGILFTILCFYFSGGTKSMNNFFFKVYEWVFSEVLDEKEKIELKGELKLYALAFMALTFTFGIYSIFELLLTKKFYDSLAHFEPIPQQETRTPAYNPDFSAPPQKVYPNLA